MQQRSSSSSSRALDECCAIIVTQQPQAKHSPRRRMDDMSAKWVHLIPVIVLMCLFVLWWFSYPVNLVIKESKIAAVHQIEMSVSLNDTHIDVAILAAATSSPIASVPLNLTSNNETGAPPPPASKSDCRTVRRICFFQHCVGTCLHEIKVLQEHFYSVL